MNTKCISIYYIYEHVPVFISNEVIPKGAIPAVGCPHIYQLSRRHEQNHLLQMLLKRPHKSVTV